MWKPGCNDGGNATALPQKINCGKGGKWVEKEDVVLTVGTVHLEGLGQMDSDAKNC